MSVNMFRCRVSSDRQPRAKNGQPVHSTTGVESGVGDRSEAGPQRQCEECHIRQRRERNQASPVSGSQ